MLIPNVLSHVLTHSTSLHPSFIQLKSGLELGPQPLAGGEEKDIKIWSCQRQRILMAALHRCSAASSSETLCPLMTLTAVEEHNSQLMDCLRIYTGPKDAFALVQAPPSSIQ